MREFYFLRHGQTDANRQGLMCGGKWDIELNSDGLGQAQVAAQALQSLPIRSVAVSPLLRARETARVVIASRLLETVVIDEWAEWDIGHWDRVPFETVKEEFLGTGEPVGGESRAEFRQRVERAWDRSQKLEGPLLIVSHGAVWFMLQEILGFPPLLIKNCAPVRVFRQDSGWSVNAI